MKKLPVVNAFKPGILKTKHVDGIQAFFNGTAFVAVQVGDKEIIPVKPEDFVSFTQISGANHEAVLNTLMNTDIDDIVCIYHGGCPDGVASAIVVLNALGEDVKLVAGHYANPLTKENIDLKGKTVLMCDFSYQLEEMNKISSLAKQVIFLDHHDTAFKKNTLFLSEDNVFAFASTHYCGASLTYQFFYPNQPLPTFIKYIEDGDLYKFELPNSREIVKGLHTMLPKSPLDGLMFLDESHLNSILPDIQFIGEKITAEAVRQAKSIIKTCRRTVTAYGHTFPLVNATPDHTNLVSELIYDNEDVPFVMIYTIFSGKVKISLRSKKGTVNVSDLAKQIMNGGGHVNAAAGFMQLDEFLREVLLKSQAYEPPVNHLGLCDCS